jgi:uncharacterized NAD-dependent epimerase/dehydratase family protein
MKSKKPIKKILYYEGEFDQHAGKFLNSLVRYSQEKIIGIFSTKPKDSLKTFLDKNNIPIFKKIEQIPHFDQLIITDLHLNKNSLVSRKSLFEKFLNNGITIVNGSHLFLKPFFPKFKDKIIDLREDTSSQRLFSGKLFKKGNQKRILTVGMDCNIGKMTASLEIYKKMKQLKLDVKFLATGQIGMVLMNGGIPLDRSIVDFTSGFMENYTENQDNEFLIIEGQGSLFTPLYSGLTVAQIHGCVPDYLILCIDPKRKHPRYFPDIKFPSIKEAIIQYENIAKLVNKKAKVVAICVNTSQMSEKEAKNYTSDLKRDVKIPIFDPVKSNSFDIIEVIPSCTSLC